MVRGESRKVLSLREPVFGAGVLPGTVAGTSVRKRVSAPFGKEWQIGPGDSLQHMLAQGLVSSDLPHMPTTHAHNLAGCFLEQLAFPVALNSSYPRGRV